MCCICEWNFSLNTDQGQNSSPAEWSVIFIELSARDPRMLDIDWTLAVGVRSWNDRHTRYFYFRILRNGSNKIIVIHIKVVMAQSKLYIQGLIIVPAHRATQLLPHWGRVTHIYVNEPTIIGSDNALSSGRRQAIIWTNAGILLFEQSIMMLINLLTSANQIAKIGSCDRSRIHVPNLGWTGVHSGKKQFSQKVLNLDNIAVYLITYLKSKWKYKQIKYQ